MRIPFRQTIGRALASATRAGLMSAADKLKVDNLYRGSGSPEGVVTASYGIYIDETNKKLYEKVSGTGNTGWREVSPSVSGTWTPTGTIVTNLDSVTPGIAFYQRVGDIVSVWGTVTVDPTAASAVTWRMSLPIASNLAAATDATGSFLRSAYVGTVTADAATDTAQFDGASLGTASIGLQYSYAYRVL